MGAWCGRSKLHTTGLTLLLRHGQVANHHAMVTGRKKLKAIRYVCFKHCGGVADRLKVPCRTPHTHSCTPTPFSCGPRVWVWRGLCVQGMIFAFWAAVLSNRAFFIDYRVPFPLEDIIAPHMVDWRVGDDGTAAKNGVMPPVDQWDITKAMNLRDSRGAAYVSGSVWCSRAGRGDELHHLVGRYKVYKRLVSGKGKDLQGIRANLVLLDFMKTLKPVADR